MYIYFDKNRVLREIINDKVTAVSSGNEFIYAYYEGQENENTHEQEYLAAVIRYRLPDGTLIPISGTQSGEEEDRQIPPNKDRDLKYFRYGKTYKFNKWEIDVTTLENGTVSATITYPSNTVMELFTFTVEDSVVDLNQSMSMSDYQYLVQLFMNKEVFAINGINTADLTQYPDNALIFDINTKIIWKKISVSPYKEEWTDLADKYTQSQIDAFLALKADLSYVNEELDKKVNLSGSNEIRADNTFTGSNVFNTAPQTNDSEYGDGTGTKLTTKNYVLGIKNDLESEIADINKVIPSNADETHKLISSAEKGASNGVATLDSNQKVPLSQLPDSILGQVEYCSNFDASSSTNQTIRTPRKGDYYICNTSGYHLPTGVDTSDWQTPIDFELGDWAIYDGSAWEKIDNTDAVQSVNGETGAVVLDGTKIALSNNDTTKITTKLGNIDNDISTINSKLPKIKDYVIPTTAWALVNGKYVAELDAGVDFVIDDNAMHLYTPTSNNDQLLRDVYGINVSSDATTQKFTFTCNIGDEAPSEVINFTIAQFGGN